MVGSLFGVSPRIDIFSSVKRERFKRGKAVVKMMDKLLDADEAALNWKHQYECLRTQQKRKAMMLLHKIATRGNFCSTTRGELLFKERVLRATHHKLKDGVAPNTAYKYISRINADTSARERQQISFSTASSASSMVVAV